MEVKIYCIYYVDVRVRVLLEIRIFGGKKKREKFVLEFRTKKSD